MTLADAILYLLKINLPTIKITKKLGRNLYNVIVKNFYKKITHNNYLLNNETSIVIHFDGNLGVGKTSLIRAFLNSAGFKNIKSPTYNLIESYQSFKILFHHIDFYRFSQAEEWLGTGLEDLVNDKNAIFLIEWPKNGQSFLSIPDILISLKYVSKGRTVDLTAYTPRGESWLKQLKTIF